MRVRWTLRWPLLSRDDLHGYVPPSTGPGRNNKCSIFICKENFPDSIYTNVVYVIAVRPYFLLR